MFEWWFWLVSQEIPLIFDGILHEEDRSSNNELRGGSSVATCIGAWVCMAQSHSSVWGMWQWVLAPSVAWFEPELDLKIWARPNGPPWPALYEHRAEPNLQTDWAIVLSPLPDSTLFSCVCVCVCVCFFFFNQTSFQRSYDC